MPSATLPAISAEEIDDLLYLARINDLHDLKAGIEAIARTQYTTTENVILAAIDPDTGNGLLHMTSANNGLDILRYLLPQHPTSTPSPLDTNLPNTSGNTPLHWAALNGHLDAVKILIGAGADPSLTNSAGHDAVYEAERSGKQEVVEWLLKEGSGLEKGVGGSTQDEKVDENDENDEEDDVREEEIDREIIKDGDKEKDGIEQVQNGMGDMKVEEKGG
ncbi:MAG: hypothetical protein Q9168_007465 [Polycauliona sp. 1 TL-2023]